jgi:hypothetical protein
MTTTDEDGLTERALAAYFRSGGTDQPSTDCGDSGVIDLDGRLYVVLSNIINGILAVYRVRPDGTLRRMKRWPKELDEDWETGAGRGDRNT